MAYVGSNLGITNTAEALTPLPQLFDYEVWVKAQADNDARVYVGTADTVTAGTADATDGYELAAGEEVCLPVTIVRDTSDIFIIAASGTQKVFWFAY